MARFMSVICCVKGCDNNVRSGFQEMFILYVGVDP